MLEAARLRRLWCPLGRGHWAILIVPLHEAVCLRCDGSVLWVGWPNRLSPRLDVRCRQCAHVWRMEDVYASQLGPMGAMTRGRQIDICWLLSEAGVGVSRRVVQRGFGVPSDRMEAASAHVARVVEGDPARCGAARIWRALWGV